MSAALAFLHWQRIVNIRSLIEVGNDLLQVGLAEVSHLALD